MKLIQLTNNQSIRGLLLSSIDEVMNMELSDVQDAYLGLVRTTPDDVADPLALRELTRELLAAEMDDYYVDASPDLTCIFA